MDRLSIAITKSPDAERATRGSVITFITSMGSANGVTFATDIRAPSLTTLALMAVAARRSQVKGLDKLYQELKEPQVGDGTGGNDLPNHSPGRSKVAGMIPPVYRPLTCHGQEFRFAMLMHCCVEMLRSVMDRQANRQECRM